MEASGDSGENDGDHDGETYHEDEVSAGNGETFHEDEETVPAGDGNIDEVSGHDDNGKIPKKPSADVKQPVYAYGVDYSTKPKVAWRENTTTGERDTVPVTSLFEQEIERVPCVHAKWPCGSITAVSTITPGELKVMLAAENARKGRWSGLFGSKRVSVQSCQAGKGLALKIGKQAACQVLFNHIDDGTEEGQKNSARKLLETIGQEVCQGITAVDDIKNEDSSFSMSSA